MRRNLLYMDGSSWDRQMHHKDITIVQKNLNIGLRRVLINVIGAEMPLL